MTVEEVLRKKASEERRKYQEWKNEWDAYHENYRQLKIWFDSYFNGVIFKTRSSYGNRVKGELRLTEMASPSDYPAHPPRSYIISIDGSIVTSISHLPQNETTGSSVCPTDMEQDLLIADVMERIVYNPRGIKPDKSEKGCTLRQLRYEYQGTKEEEDKKAAEAYEARTQQESLARKQLFDSLCDQVLTYQEELNKLSFTLGDNPAEVELQRNDYGVAVHVYVEHMEVAKTSLNISTWGSRTWGDPDFGRLIGEEIAYAGVHLADEVYG